MASKFNCYKYAFFCHIISNENKTILFTLLLWFKLMLNIPVYSVNVNLIYMWISGNFENDLLCRALRDLQEGEELTICYIGNISKFRFIFLSTDPSTIYHPTNIVILLSTTQCCGTGSAWIRIKLKDRIRFCVKFAEDKQNCMENERIWALFNIWAFCCEARIRIRIRNRIEVKGRIQIWIRICIKWQAGTGSAQSDMQDPNPGSNTVQ